MTDDVDQVQKVRKQEKKRNILTALFAVAAMLFLVLTFWQQATGNIPNITVPNPRMPWRNAHDAYVAASNAIVDDNKIGYAVGSKHSGNGDDVSYTLAEKEALVAENAALLKQLRTSFADPYMAPPARSFNVLLPYYAKFRGMARLLRLEQQVEETRGDWDGAINSGLDAMLMGAQMEHGAVLIGSLVGIACQAIGRRNIWDEVDHLNAAQARKAARRMEKIVAAHVSFADTVQEEEWMGQAGLLEVFRKPGGKQELFKSLGSMMGSSEQGQSGARVGQMMQGLKLAMVGPRGVILNYTRYMDALRTRDEARYGERSAMPAVPDDPVNQMLLPVFDQADFNDAVSQAQNALLEITFALRAYYVEHHAYPQTLAELAPAYLKQIPQDPFGSTGVLQYRRNGAKYLLYSVGPDGKDDHGKFINDAQRALNGNNDYARRVQPDSQGDIVAGVNR